MANAMALDDRGLAIDGLLWHDHRVTAAWSWNIMA